MSDDIAVHEAAAKLAAAGLASHEEAVEAITKTVSMFVRPPISDLVVWHADHKHRLRKDGSLSPAYYGPGAPPP